MWIGIQWIKVISSIRTGAGLSGCVASIPGPELGRRGGHRHVLEVDLRHLPPNLITKAMVFVLLDGCLFQYAQNGISGISIC